MSKLIWTLTSAAQELGLSKRAMIRCCVRAGIGPTKLENCKPHYIFGPAEMKALRAKMKNKS